MGWPKGKKRSEATRQKMSLAQRARHGNTEHPAVVTAPRAPKRSDTPTYRAGSVVRFNGSAPFMLAGSTGTVTSVDGGLLRIKCGILTVELPPHYVRPEPAAAPAGEAKAA